MSQEEAFEQQHKFQHLEKIEFTDKENSRKYIVLAVLIMPSETAQFIKLSELLAIYYYNPKNPNNSANAESFMSKYEGDFTVVLLAKTTSSKNPDLKFLPIQYLANQSGDLILGFAI